MNKEEIKIKSNDMGYCPVCDNDDLDYDSVQFEGNMCYFPWHCKWCGTTGNEWYNLEFVGHDNVYDKDDEYINMEDNNE